MSLQPKIREYINQLSQQGLLRARSISDPSRSDIVFFDSNDYLSLKQDRRIASGYAQGYQRYPSGSGASMLLSGYHPNHHAVERDFAEFLEVDDCLLFSSGYAANLAVTSLLGQIQAHALIDKGIHASVYDGLKLAGVNYSRYWHNDLEDLGKKINRSTENTIILTEGVFSMSGQMAPLAAISALGQIPLVVDEAHSFGVLGHQGAGAVNAHHLSQKEVPLRIIPLGKAFAAQGAIVAGQREWIQGLLQAGRSIIYSTAISPALSYGLLKTLEVVIQAEERRAHLKQVIDWFRTQIKNSSLTWSDSLSAIQQIQLGCPHKALEYTHQLKNKGIHCSAIRMPTVNLKATGLRIILNYDHTPEQVDNLFKQLESLQLRNSLR